MRHEAGRVNDARTMDWLNGSMIYGKKIRREVVARLSIPGVAGLYTLDDLKDAIRVDKLAF